MPVITHDVCVRGALQLAVPWALTAQEIRASTKEHQKWRIDERQGPNTEVAAKVDSDIATTVGVQGPDSLILARHTRNFNKVPSI